MEGGYTRVSGKNIQRAHALNMDHMVEAIREVINKNSGEHAFKEFGDFRCSESIGISKQVDTVARMVDEFFPEEMVIRTNEYDANGAKTEKLSKPIRSRMH